MLRWLSSLFRSDPVAPAQDAGIYRAPKRGTSPVSRPVTETLFERPAVIPQAAPVVVVPPATEADGYRWLDDKLPLSVAKPAPIVIHSTAPAEATRPVAATGSFLSGCYSVITGCSTFFCGSGIYRHRD